MLAEKVYEDPSQGSSITTAEIDRYLESLRGTLAPETIRSYRSALYMLYNGLPADKVLRSDSLWNFKEQLEQRGYSAATISKKIVIANNLLDYIQRRDLQLTNYYQTNNAKGPELTRGEYLRLLSIARALDDRRGYLIVKLFASVDLPTNGTSAVTVEAVTDGVLMFFNKNETKLLRLPIKLQEELLDFAAEQGIRSGYIFRSRSGGAILRENVHDILQRLCMHAGIDTSKGNVSCLKRLYQTTRNEIEAKINVEALIAQLQDRLLEKEEKQIGWD